MKFRATVVEDNGTTYTVQNSPQDIVRWEARAKGNNVEALRKFTSIAQILHGTAVREGLTEHKGFDDWLTHVDDFEMEDADAADPTVQAQSDD